MTTNASRPTLVWIALMAATVALTWVLTRTSVVALVTLAGIKVTLVASEFMELRHAPRVLQAVTLTWVVAVTTMIAAFHLVTP